MRRRDAPRDWTCRRRPADRLARWPAVWRWLTTLLALSLCAQTSFAGTVSDTGEVVVDAANDLLIGIDTLGSRTVDAAVDGPYSSVSLGVNAGSSGELTLDHGASLSTPGALTVGDQGQGTLGVLGGSSLSTASAALGSPATGERSQIVVDGLGSSWQNAGELDLFNTAPWPLNVGILVSGGGFLSTDGIAYQRSLTLSGTLDLIVTGAGSLLDNSGILSLSAAGHKINVSIQDGGRMVDTGAAVSSSYGTGGISVDGTGSTWESGDIGLWDSWLGVTNGGTVRADSLSAIGAETSAGFAVAGAGSLLEVAGRVSAGCGSACFAGFSVTDGAHVVSSGGRVSGWASASVLGSGSTWQNNGDIEIDEISYHFSIAQGGQVFNQNANYTGCLDPARGCTGIQVSDPGSLWHSDGNLSVNGPMAVDNGGAVVAGGRLDVLAQGQLQLDGGLVTAGTLNVDGGSLTGRGAITGNVINGGVVDLGVPGTPGSGQLSIDGDYEQGSGAVLDITLYDAAAGGSDLLTVLGTAVLGGQLSITLADGFVPEVGDEFLVLSYGSRAGTFADIAGLDLGDGLLLQPVYGATGMSLVAVPEPDAALLVGIGLVGVAAPRRRGAKRG